MTTKPTTTATGGERQKSNRFLLTKLQICTSIMLIWSFLCRRCTPGTWKFQISHARFMESVNTTQKLSFSFSKLNTVLSDSTWENFTNICQIKWNWMGSMKFETVRIHFLSDVFGLLSSKNFATMTTWRNDFSFSLIPSDLSWLVICPLKALFIFVIFGVGSG